MEGVITFRYALVVRPSLTMRPRGLGGDKNILLTGIDLRTLRVFSEKKKRWPGSKIFFFSTIDRRNSPPIRTHFHYLMSPSCVCLARYWLANLPIDTLPFFPMGREGRERTHEIPHAAISSPFAVISNVPVHLSRRDC